MPRKKPDPTFKPYHQHQLMLLPPSLDELIAENHPVRVVNRVVDSLDLTPLIEGYKGGGNSSYHPAMLLKVLVYAYLRNIYSTRKMEEALGESVHFMWLAGNAKPDHNTLARFRSERLAGKVRTIFSQVVELLVEEGLVTLKEAFVDGTKIEANANRYTFIWGKSIKTNKEKMLKQLRELLDYAEQVGASEVGPAPAFEEIDAEKVRAAVERINQALADTPVEKKVKQKLNYAKRHWPEALERYAKQEEMLGGRNSCSKTDPGATFMRMKEDHMGNGQLKPGYNVQASTENQFVTNYSVHHNPGDTKTLGEHLDLFKDTNGQLPANLTADAGYGSEENYERLADEGVEAYVKFNKFDSERHKGIAPFNPDGWKHDETENCFYCPQGRKLVHVSTHQRTTEAGFKQTIDTYRSLNCDNCPVRSQCTKSEKNREIEVSHKLRRHKQAARERLTSEEGVARRKRRCHEPETVFGEWKHNKGFRRFNLRTKPKVETELGILVIAHNLKKMAG